MSKSREILDVNRPVNTFVSARRKDGSYEVRSRAGYKMANGMPHHISGKVIDCIADGKFVSRKDRPTVEELIEMVSA